MDKQVSIPIVFSFSGGKDSSLALYRLMRSNYKIVSLITTITNDYNRVSMHGISEKLLIEQVNSIGLPLHLIHIPSACVNEEYERIMYENLLFYKNLGVEYVGFGDIFLEDVRAYRENNLKKLNMRGIFPIWGENTKNLAEEFIKLGFKAIVVCVNLDVLDISFLGREFDENSIKELKDNVDICGENGEFHTFVYDGPIFRKALNVKTGHVVIRENYGYIDLLTI